jgi:hypothetical protein
VDRAGLRATAAAFLLIGVGFRGIFAQAQLPDFDPRTTAIEALLRLREGIEAAVVTGDLPQLRGWISLSEQGLPGKRVLWLWPNERLLLAFWLGDYQSAEAFLVPGPVSDDGPRPYLPPSDLLFRRIQEASAGRREQLKQGIRSSGLDADRRYFLLLLFDYLLKLDPLSREEQLELNRAAKYFILRFPSSSYRSYVDRVIVSPAPRPSPWGWGLDLGPAYTVFFGELRRSYTDSFGFTCGVDVAYKRLVTYLRMQRTTLTTSGHYSSGGVWDSGTVADVIWPELGVGYLVAASRRFKLAPFAGAGLPWFLLESYQTPIMELHPSLSMLNYNAGMELDFRWGAYHSKDRPIAPRTNFVLRARAVLGASKVAHEPRFEATYANIALMLQVFIRPQLE